VIDHRQLHRLRSAPEHLLHCRRIYPYERGDQPVAPTASPQHLNSGTLDGADRCPYGTPRHAERTCEHIARSERNIVERAQHTERKRTQRRARSLSRGDRKRALRWALVAVLRTLRVRTLLIVTSLFMTSLVAWDCSSDVRAAGHCTG
jgi:hypothetical protein